MILVGLLFATASMAAAPYKAIDYIEELQIPYCLDQFGYKCLACGYDSGNSTHTAPNQDSTMCLPSKAGCTKFADLKGELCDKSAYCSCGFNRDYWGNCVP